jgi:hypothetical protein
MNTQSPAIGRPSSSKHERWYSIAAGLLAAYFLATSIFIACHRLFWYDEVFTTLTTRMPDWHTIWRALVEDNSDPSTFGFFAVARLFDRLLGPAEIGIRLPSALAMTVGMLLTYDCARRLTNRLHGLIAMAVLSCSFVTYYGYEGRSYAMFFMLASAALWAWIGGRGALFTTLLFCAGTMIHCYFALCVVPFVLDEAWNWRARRRPSNRIIGAFSGVCVGLLCLAPQLLASRGVHGKTWWAIPKIRAVGAMFTEFFPAGLLLLALTAVWIACSGRQEAEEIPPVSPGERTAWLFVTIPFAGFVVALLVTHAFLHRYFIGVLPGIAVGFACVIWRCCSNPLRTPVGILVLLAGYGIANQAIAVAHWDKINQYGPSHERTRDLMALEDQLRAKGAHYIVFDGWDLRYLEVRYYSKHPERYAYWMPTKVPPSRYYPTQVWDLEDIKRHAAETVLLDVTSYRMRILQEAGIHFRVWEADDFLFTFLY